MAALEKKYTRESTIMIQEIWLLTAMIDLPTRFGGEIPRPAIAVDFSEGMMTIWMNPETHQYYLQKAVEQFGDVERLREVVRVYREQLDGLNELWRTPAKTSAELREAAEKMRHALASMHTTFYVAGSDASPAEARKLALEVRKEDVFFMKADEYLRQSLLNLLPETPELIWFVTLEDLEKGIETSNLLARREKFLYVDGVSCGPVSLIEYMTTHPEIQLVEEVLEDVQEVKGQVANRGKVTGRVRVVRNTRDAAAVEVGDIIVSPMTVPDYLLAMKKAAAFVTDEGGITCHAAIVSRELGKPCVIGTKVATRAFKDGDEIEVDADAGVVRRLS